jgi:hypothetical protein
VLCPLFEGHAAFVHLLLSHLPAQLPFVQQLLSQPHLVVQAEQQGCLSFVLLVVVAPFDARADNARSIAELAITSLRFMLYCFKN